MSETTTIRVSKDIYNSVKTLAQQENENMQAIIEQAIADYKKKKFFESLNSAYAKLKSDPHAWEEELNEREEWDKVIDDGLVNEDEN
jgi:predicted transcriptional regulator